MHNSDRTPALDRAAVEKIASLANLELTDEEKSAFYTELTAIVAFADHLAALPTDHMIADDHFSGNANVFREDCLCPSLDQATVLRMAARHDGDCFIVDQAL